MKEWKKWRQSFNAFLDLYTKDQTQLTEQAFLETTLKVDNLDEINADRLYNTFMLGEGKGDIEFFARRIVDTHTDKLEEIEKNRELINGDNSAKISELLTCGIANARHNPDKFIASAQEESTWRGCLDVACRKLGQVGGGKTNDTDTTATPTGYKASGATAPATTT